MGVNRGLIRGFLLGVVVASIAAALVAFYVYRQVESKISPEGIQTAAQKALTQSIGQPVEVGSASLSLPNLLTLDRLRISEGDETVVAIEKVEAYAEGGVQGIQDNRFVRLVLTNPVLSLERQDGVWNLETFLAPILSRLARSASPATVDSATAAPTPTGSVLQLVEISGLKVSVTLEDGAAYSGIELGQLTAHRNQGTWDLIASEGTLRLNPLADQWPLLDVLELVQNLKSTGQGAATVEGPADTPPAGPDSADALDWLGSVSLETIDLEVVSIGQNLTLGGLSFKGTELLQILQFQTGSIEKKNGIPRS